MTQLLKVGMLNSPTLSFEILFQSVQQVIENLVSVVGDYHVQEGGDPLENYFTFILSNGQLMIAHQGGKELYYSTHKGKCSQREMCPSFSTQCETKPTSSGGVSHMIFSSEPLQGENVWEKMKPGQIMGVDKNMIFYF